MEYYVYICICKFITDIGEDNSLYVVLMLLFSFLMKILHNTTQA